MLIRVKAFPKSGREEVVEGNGELRAYVKAAPEGGKANAAVAKLLAAHFGVHPSAVRLVSGATSRRKAFEIIV